VLQGELARLIRTSPPLKAALASRLVAIAHDVTVGSVPGFGSGQNDTFVNRDNVDPTHPMNLSYLVPSNAQRVVSARLSWRLHAFRTYSSLTLSNTGGESGVHNHPHTTTHGHSWHIYSAPGSGPASLWSSVNTVQEITAGAQDIPTTAVAPGSTDNNTTDHTHSVSGTTTLGIAEGASATGITISFDGVDKTALLGGPWSTDVVELDVTPFLTLRPAAAWHTITLSSATLGQIESHLRIAFYANAGAPS
jgi:hypothetical protein